MTPEGWQSMSQCSQPRGWRRFGGSIAALMIAACVVAVPAQASTRPAIATPSLEIQAPEHVAAGQAITVTIAVRGARSVAGWEARVRFDSASAEFAGASGMGRGIGRSGGQLGPVSTSDGIAVGGYTSRARSSRGSLTLVRVRLLPHVSGMLGVSVGDVRLVNRSGHRLRLNTKAHSVTIRVGSGRRHARRTTGEAPRARSRRAGRIKFTRPRR